MTTLEIANKIMENLAAGRSSFTIDTGERGCSIFYNVADLGTGKVLYSKYFYRVEDLLETKGLVPSAIQTRDGKFCVLDPFAAFSQYAGELPENWMTLKTYLDTVNAAMMELFRSFCDKLPLREPTEIERNRISEKFRRCAVLGDEQDYYLNLDNVLCESDYVLSLLDLVDPAQKTTDYLKRNEDYFVRHKVIVQAVREHMENGTGTKPWEFDLAAALRDLNAKTVNVEFFLGGKRAAAKVELETLKRIFMANDFFSYYDFANKVEGKRVIQELDAGTWRGSSKPILRLENITSITYGRKQIYFH